MSGDTVATGSTALSVVPAEATLEPGDSLNLKIGIQQANGGVGAFKLILNLSDPSIVDFTGAEIRGDPKIEKIEIASEGSSVHLAADLIDTDNEGSVVITDVNVSAESTETTDIFVNPIAVGDETGNEYSLTAIGVARLTMGSMNLIPTLRYRLKLGRR